MHCRNTLQPFLYVMTDLFLTTVGNSALFFLFRLYSKLKIHLFQRCLDDESFLLPMLNLTIILFMALASYIFLKKKFTGKHLTRLLRASAHSFMYQIRYEG